VARLRTLQGVYVFDLLGHRITTHCGYKSVTKRHRYRRPSREHHVIPNHIQNQWNEITPLAIVVSDLTMIRHVVKQVEWVFVLDTFNNEISASALATRPGDLRPLLSLFESTSAQKKRNPPPHVASHRSRGRVFQPRLTTNSD
jgi:hypothetical protein